MGVSIIAHPFITRLSTAPGDRLGKDTFLIMMAILSMTLKKERELNLIGIFIFCLVGFFAFFNQHNFLSVNVFYQFCYFSFGLILLINFMCSKAEFEKYFFYSAILVSTFTICEYFGLDLRKLYLEIFYPQISIVRNNPENIIAGPLNHPNLTGAYLALCIPIVMKFNKWFLIPIGAAIIVGDCIMPMVTAIGALVGYYLIQYMGWVYLITIIGMITSFFTGLGGLDNERFTIWKKSLQINNSFLTGNGLGWFTDTFNAKKIYPIRVEQEHNEFLSILNAFGAWFFGLLFYLFAKINNEKDRVVSGVIFAMFINFYGNFALHSSVISVLCIYFLAKFLRGPNGTVMEWEGAL